MIQLTLMSGSMSPTLPTGSRVRVQPDRLLPFRPGVIACFNAGGTLMVHRLLQEIRWGRRRWFIHRGDASRIPGLLGERDLVGRVTEVEREGRWEPLPDQPEPSVRDRLECVVRLTGRILGRRGAQLCAPTL